MPTYANITVTAAGSTEATSTDWIPLNQHNSDFSVGFGVAVSASGALTYRVEHTFQKPTGPRDENLVIFTHEDVSAATTNQDGNYAFPVAATRATIVSAQDVDSRITFYVRQSGV